MPSVSATPKSRKQRAQSPKATGSSWPRLLITQQLPKALDAALTLHSPSFASVKEKYPLQSSMEETSPKHQFLPLSPLPSIAELPKQEPAPKVQADSRMPALTQGSEAREQGTSLRSDRDPEPNEAQAMSKAQGKKPEVQDVPERSSISSTSSFTEAANVPLPESPVTEDSHAPQLGPDSDASKTQPTDPVSGTNIEEKDTWASKLASILHALPSASPPARTRPAPKFKAPSRLLLHQVRTLSLNRQQNLWRKLRTQLLKLLKWKMVALNPVFHARMEKAYDQGSRCP